MITFILFFLIAACTHVLIKMKYSHWSRKGVKEPAPLPFVGNYGRLIMQKQSITQLGEEAYKQFPNENIVGLYYGFTPVLLLREPELINQVMTTDFNYFVNRGVRTAEQGFSNNLLASEDEVWRTIRQKMTPAFTSTKLKQMFPLSHEYVNRFTHQVEICTDSEGNCDVKELAARYAMELICSFGFGLKLDFYSDDIKQFREIGKETITPSAFFRLWNAAEMIIPGIHSMFPAVDPTAKIRAFFIKLVSDVINERKNNKDNRKDFMDILMKLMQQEQIKVNGEKGITEFKVDVNFIASQVFVFYTTGCKTSSSTLSYLLYELALHEDYQDIVYEEILTVLDKHNGELTYDAINELSYLRKVLNETLRKHSFVGWILRKASKDYTLPGTNVHVKAGTGILVSTVGLHSDPKYFEDPDTYDPENFSSAKFKQISQCAYIPFGVGPRNCIGFRFAKLNIMMAAVAFLQKFRVSPCTDKQKKVKYDSISITLSPVDGIWVNVSKRN